MKITVETPIVDSPRVAQVRGMFDLPAEKTSRLSWNVHLPIERERWSIGLIVGPSGCGKTTLARRLFPGAVYHGPGEDAIDGQLTCVDAFPEAMHIDEIATLLSAVGFASPPAWLRPIGVLSTGQQFRVRLALLLARTRNQPLVFDEYTSVVDRTVAQVGSAAVAKVIRQRRQQFVAVTCHDDVEPWLDPDWVYRPAEDRFERRLLRRRRPEIALDVVRVAASAWPMFAPHHYLSGRLARSATCFLASWNGRPVAFSAWLPFVSSGPKSRREHRTVTLPDYQGVGIGNALSDFVASVWTGLGYRALSTTTHPAMIRARLRSPRWRMHRRPSFAAGNEGRIRHATTRLTAGFHYVGPGLARAAARVLLEVRS